MEELVRIAGYAVGAAIVGVIAYVARSRKRDRERTQYQAQKDDLEAIFERRMRDRRDR
jgi:biopolymer transport protein ExbB/TolQ